MERLYQPPSQDSPAAAVHSNEADLNALLASVGLLDDDDAQPDPFAGLSRDEITCSLKEWRQKFARLAADGADVQTQSTTGKPTSPNR